MSSYSPYEDPLLARHPGAGCLSAPTYWQATAGLPPEDDGALSKAIACDVVIIGGGYTGLSCAHFLASRYGFRPLVLEAHVPGWGCSGRNGSFARPAVGRLPVAEWVTRWGERAAQALFNEGLSALDTVRELIDEGTIDCDRMPDGWLKLAHRPSRIAALEKEHHLLKDIFGQETCLLGAETLARDHFRGGEAYGALRWDNSFAMHPLKLAYGLVRLARRSGASVHSATPVLGLAKDGAWHLLGTPYGTVRARHVVVASNGYTLELAFPFLRGRLLPVLSNIVVTQPLTVQEFSDGNFVTSDAMCDTRAMLYYFRRLPDNRILLGGKGPPRDQPVAMEAHKRHLLEVVSRKFPFLERPRADYFWGGWVALTYDFMPHVATAEDDPTLHYALGYMGSGVSFSMHAGRRIAERIAGAPPNLPPPIAAGLPRFPLAAFRRVGQRIMMRWYAFRDRRD